MKLKSIVSTFLIVLIFNNVEAGDVYDKMSKKICKCIEKDKATNSDEMMPCMQRIMTKNFTDIMKYHGVETMDQLNGQMVGGIITGRLAADCPYVAKMMRDTLSKTKAQQHVPDSVLNCDGAQTGEFYYLTPHVDGGMDTTYVTMSETSYMERMYGGKTYSRLGIEWKNKCEFTLTFIESNDAMKGAMSKPGDQYHYTIIKNNKVSTVLEMLWHDQKFQIELVRTKPL